MRRIFVFVSLALLGLGGYLKFIYDVPDSQEKVNFFTSGFCIIIFAGEGQLLYERVLHHHRPGEPLNQPVLVGAKEET